MDAQNRTALDDALADGEKVGGIAGQSIWVKAKKLVAGATLLKNGEGRTFYAVGGTWRNIAKLHMEIRKYPLHMMQGYELPYDEIAFFLEEIISGANSRDPAWSTISKSRRNLIPFGAIAMREVIETMQPKSVCFSAQGVREGYLYSLLLEEEQQAAAQAVVDELGWKDRWYLVSAIGRDGTWPIMLDVMAFFDRQREEAAEAAAAAAPYGAAD